MMNHFEKIIKKIERQRNLTAPYDNILMNTKKIISKDHSENS